MGIQDFSKKIINRAGRDFFEGYCAVVDQLDAEESGCSDVCA